MKSPIYGWAMVFGIFATGVAVAQEGPTQALGTPARFVRVAPTVFPGVLPDEFDVVPAQAVGGKEKDKGKTKEKDKEKPPPPVPPAPESDQLAAAPPTGLEAPEGINPRMIGDLPGTFSLAKILLPTVVTTQTFKLLTFTRQTATGVLQTVTIRVPGPTFQTVTNAPVVTRVVLPFAGAMKIGENQSPAPEDRVFLTYNYYNDVRGPSGPPVNPAITSVPTTVNGAPAIASFPSAGLPPAIDLHRQLFGFEKTFLDGAGSFGMRLPFAQVQGDGSVGQQDIGDLSAIVNFALLRGGRDAFGNILSTGLMVTLPTGPPVNTVQGNIHPPLYQPFMGYRWTADRLCLQGFSSLAVPGDARVVMPWFNDVAVGYWLYRGTSTSTITAIIPTIEAHVTTPLNHRNVSDPITIPDFVALTAGVHIGFSNRAMLTLGVTTGVTGPQLFPVEAVAQFNYRY
jgi:hypothetical protein